MNSYEDMGKERICLNKQENNHAEAYLTWVHQSDGTSYYKCETCGWIKSDTESLEDRLKEWGYNKGI